MSLLDPKWKYTHSTATDIRKTFKRARTKLAKKPQPAARQPKLQLLPAPQDGGLAGQHAARSAGADASQNHENQEYPALISARFDRRVGA